MGLFQREQHVQRHEGGAGAPQNFQRANQTAIVESQHFLANLYYPGVPIGTNKAVTEQMKNIILDPISAYVKTPHHEQPGEKTKIIKKLPSLIDWQERRAQNLTFEDFKELVSQEFLRDSGIKKDLLLQEYVIRSVSDSLHLVDIRGLPTPSTQAQEAAQYAVAPPRVELSETASMISEEKVSLLPFEMYDEKQLKKYDSIIDGMQKVAKITGQIQEFGVDNTNLYYKNIRVINAATSPKDLDIAKTDLMRDYPYIREFLQSTNNIQRGREAMSHMSKLESDLIMAIGDKRINIVRQDKIADDLRAELNTETSAKMVSDQFENGYEYLTSLIPEGERKMWDSAPYHILKLAIGLRKVFPVANTEALAQIWWQLRLGGARANDIYEHLKREMPDYVKANKLKKYSEHLSDNYLSSEAAGFEFQKEISISHGATPNGLIFQTMKELIQHHIPKNQEYVRFTIIEGEQNIRKITLPYHDGITDSEISANIKAAILTNRWTQQNLSDRERADLSYKGYSAQDRIKDKKYKQIYNGFGVNEKSKEEYAGDYLIQIGSIYDNTRDPRSLFAVDSHKVAVQLQLKNAGTVTATARYNHSYFDGVPADVNSKEVFSGLSSADIVDAPAVLPSSVDSFGGYLTKAIATAVESNSSTLPLIEARADYEDVIKYEKKVLGDGAVITPTEMRGLTVAIANDIQYYQYLIAKQTSGAYFTRNPNSNDIQPVVVAPVALKKTNKAEWAARLRLAVKRAKESVGDVALFSSVAGTKEGLLAVAGSRLNPALTKMLRNSQGMISAFTGQESGVAFTTAISNGYLPQQIDLNSPEPSMGVLGMYLQKDGTAHYTTRLLPSQAQKYFRQAALDLCLPNLAEDGQRLVLNEFNKVIQAWDRLIYGQSAGASAIGLKEYEKIRDDAIHNLAVDGLIHDESKIESGEKLQMYLNETLQNAANDILNEAKLKEARKKLEQILED